MTASQGTSSELQEPRPWSASASRGASAHVSQAGYALPSAHMRPGGSFSERKAERQLLGPRPDGQEPQRGCAAPPMGSEASRGRKHSTRQPTRRPTTLRAGPPRSAPARHAPRPPATLRAGPPRSARGALASPSQEPPGLVFLTQRTRERGPEPCPCPGRPRAEAQQAGTAPASLSRRTTSASPDRRVHERIRGEATTAAYKMPSVSRPQDCGHKKGL